MMVLYLAENHPGDAPDIDALAAPKLFGDFMQKHSRGSASIAALAVLSMASLLSTPSAYAASNSSADHGTAPASYGRKFSGYDIKITSGPQNGKVMPRILASCQVGGSGGTCKIQNSVKVSTTFTSSAKIGVKEFEGSTGISIASEYSTTLESTSPKMNSRQMYVAYPAGTFYTYNWTHYTAWVKDGSGKGTVFVPTGIQYKVIKH